MHAHAARHHGAEREGARDRGREDRGRGEDEEGDGWESSVKLIVTLVTYNAISVTLVPGKIIEAASA